MKTVSDNTVSATSAGTAPPEPTKEEEDLNLHHQQIRTLAHEQDMTINTPSPQKPPVFDFYSSASAYIPSVQELADAKAATDERCKIEAEKHTAKMCAGRDDVGIVRTVMHGTKLADDSSPADAGFIKNKRQRRESNPQPTPTPTTISGRKTKFLANLPVLPPQEQRQSPAVKQPTTPATPATKKPNARRGRKPNKKRNVRFLLKFLHNTCFLFLFFSYFFLFFSYFFFLKKKGCQNNR